MKFGSTGLGKASKVLADFKFRVVSSLCECLKEVEETF